MKGKGRKKKKKSIVLPNIFLVKKGEKTNKQKKMKGNSNNI